MKKERKGFERLRGVAAMALMGVGAFMGGSARASSKTMAFDVTRGAVWSTVTNSDSLFSGTVRTTTNGLKLAKTGTGSSSTAPDAFGIDDASISGHNDAFDNALNLVVGGKAFVNPDTTVDLTGDTVTSDKVTNIIPHIDAQVTYWFSPTRPVVRAVYALTNTSGADITTDVLVAGNYGSDDSTTVEATDSSDTTIEKADKWFITSDTAASDPIILTTRYGTGAGVVPTNALTPGGGEDDYGFRYHVTVPANSTIRVMVFHEIANSATAGIVTTLTSAAADYDSLATLQAAGLLTGLSATEKAEIVNYVPKADARSGDSGGGGALGGIALAGLGLAALRRRQREMK
jgi:MYXO-CTERM domain-containing protein